MESNDKGDNMNTVKVKLADILKEADTKISEVFEDHKDEFKINVQAYWSEYRSCIVVDVNPVKRTKEVKN